MAALRHYQAEAVAFARAGGRTIYGDPPGTGKTASSLTYASGQPGRTLIVVPANVLLHWKAQAGIFVPDYPIAMYRGSDGAKARAAAVESWLDTGGALITNYEAMRRDADWLKRAKPTTAIFDEAHRLKNRKTQTTMAANTLVRKISDHLYVTGTPVMNRAEELWAYLHLISPTVYTSYWAWAWEHFKVKRTTFGGRVQRPIDIVGDIREGHEAILAHQLHSVLIQRPMAYLLPELGEEPTMTTIPVELTPAERKVYDHLIEHEWIDTEDGEYISATGIANYTRSRQVIADWQRFLPEKGLGTKLTAARDLIEDLGEPTVVFTLTQASADRLAEKIPGALTYHGGLSAEQREANRLAFALGRAPALVGTIAALGVGVDGLQGAGRHVVFVDLDPVYDINRQAIGRLWRSGQEGHVSVWNIAAVGTVDEDLAASLAAQKDMKQWMGVL